MRPFTCANISVGAKTAPIQAAAMAQRQKLPRPHPAIPAFFDINRGNFKPNRPLHTERRHQPNAASGLLPEQN
jgi:hypothetical protein